MRLCFSDIFRHRGDKPYSPCVRLSETYLVTKLVNAMTASNFLDLLIHREFSVAEGLFIAEGLHECQQALPFRILLHLLPLLR